jgi:hypothetical protein
MSDDHAPPIGKKYAMAFFDGQNLFQHAKEAFGHHHPNYDPKKLHHAVCEALGLTPNLTRFYTGVPSESESKMWSGYWSNRVLAMKRAGILETTRKLRYHKEIIERSDGTSQVISTPQEKGIDVRIALDLVACARRKEFQVERSIEIVCAFPDSPSASYRRGVERTTWFKMDQAFYDACIDHRDYRPSRL